MVYSNSKQITMMRGLERMMMMMMIIPHLDIAMSHQGEVDRQGMKTTGSDSWKGLHQKEIKININKISKMKLK